MRTIFCPKQTLRQENNTYFSAGFKVFLHPCATFFSNFFEALTLLWRQSRVCVPTSLGTKNRTFFGIFRASQDFWEKTRELSYSFWLIFLRFYFNLLQKKNEIRNIFFVFFFFFFFFFFATFWCPLSESAHSQRVWIRSNWIELNLSAFLASFLWAPRFHHRSPSVFNINIFLEKLGIFHGFF